MRLQDIKYIFHKELDTIYGKQEVDSLFYLLTDAFYKFPKFQLALQPELAINKTEQKPIFKALDLLKKEIPVQYIIGNTDFYDCKIKVDPNVLIPRPETEELVDWILKTVDHEIPIRILDIGTGSGCIAIALAKHLPKAKVYGLDISEEALLIAKENGNYNKVEIQFIRHNILKTFTPEGDSKIKQWDLIVSNPPYVRTAEKKFMRKNVLDNEPELALYVSDSNPLLFYKAICDFAVDNLKIKGSLFFEINQYLGDSMIQLLKDYRYQYIELKKDISNNSRMLKAIKQ